MMDSMIKATDFVALEKAGDVYEFHTVTDFGGHFIDHHQGGKFDRIHVKREEGNKIYTDLIMRGYKPLGRFEMDLIGHKRKKE